MLSLGGQFKSSLNCNLRVITHAQNTYTHLFTGRISKPGLHSLQSYGCVRITSWITLVGYVHYFLDFVIVEDIRFVLLFLLNNLAMKKSSSIESKRIETYI